MIANYQSAKVKYSDLIFGVLFQQRTYGYWKKIKVLIDAGELGILMRASWVITTWYRTQYYYDHGDWRATWKGEGSGVLLNKCPHQLDIYQWLFGLPERIHDSGALGKYHKIEVEDEVVPL